MVVTSLPTPTKARFRRMAFAAALVLTHVLIGAAGWTLSNSGVDLPGIDTAGTATDDTAANDAANDAADDEPAIDATSDASTSEASTTDDRTPTGAVEAVASEPASDGDGGSGEPLPVAPSAASHFVDVATTRVLDTRELEPVAPGETTSVDLGPHISPEATAVALSVTVLAAPSPGAVTADLGGGPVTVADVNSPMVTNLVFVPRVQVDKLTLNLAGGGHVVADVVGYFQPSPAATGGRFIPVAPQPIGRLWTETQGRQTTVTVADSGALPASSVGSVLVRIRADVGGEGGQVRLGPAPDDLPNVMFWSPTSEGDRTRQGVAIVSLDERGQLSVDYAGGTELNIDLLGYFTNDEGELSTVGLFVPVPGTRLYEGALPARTATPLDVAEQVASGREVSAVAMTVTAAAEKPGDVFTYNADVGLPRSTMLDLGAGVPRTAATAQGVDGNGRVLLFSEVDLEVTIESTGYFLAG